MSSPDDPLRALKKLREAFDAVTITEVKRCDGIPYLPADQLALREAICEVLELEAVLASRAPQDETPLRELIWRVVTGDGAQLENLAMTDDEWEGSMADAFGMDNEHMEVTLSRQDWLDLVRAARASRDDGSMVRGHGPADEQPSDGPTGKGGLAIPQAVRVRTEGVSYSPAIDPSSGVAKETTT